MNTIKEVKKTLKSLNVNKEVAGFIIGYMDVLSAAYKDHNMLLLKFDSLLKHFLNSSQITEHQYNKLYNSVLNALF
ncbi:hypothetical protein J3E07_001632 [Methanococcus voltae]|uniref:Uncharacterized protein n=1 Tax=Methanococcus voltae TaxID=2188 RepID=A0A8J7RNK4_METVO|nr:hypothetical protein [Methanococcus voltae]MBP2202191.1 hypothetical protein [Methanococcus voltae]